MKTTGNSKYLNKRKKRNWNNKRSRSPIKITDYSLTTTQGSEGLKKKLIKE